MRATDTPAQLVQLGQTEFVGAIDDNGVGARYIDTGFDNRRRNQQIKALMVEIEHD